MMNEPMKACGMGWELQCAKLRGQHAAEIKRLNALHQEEVERLNNQLCYISDRLVKAEHVIDIYIAQIKMVDKLLAILGKEGKTNGK